MPRFPINPVRIRLAVVIATFATSCVASPSSSAADSSDFSPVIVRSQINPIGKRGSGKSGYELGKGNEGEGKTYVVLLVQPIQSIEKLVKPVSADDVRSEIVRQMNRHGYIPVEKGKKPDMLITAKFGRGFPPNTYLAPDHDIDDISYEPPPKRVAIWEAKVGRRLGDIGISSRATVAGFEKLFISVRAWKYPSDPKEKPVVLWITSMTLDDPDHRDLNLEYKKMIAAGAPFFNHAVGEEVDVPQDVAEGRVNIGTPEVVPSKEERR